MNNDKKYTAYCGLFCLDCIPSNERLFELLKELNELLEDLKFNKYAELKSKSNKMFDDYPKFQNVLQEMKKLECRSIKNL